MQSISNRRTIMSKMQYLIELLRCFTMKKCVFLTMIITILLSANLHANAEPSSAITSALNLTGKKLYESATSLCWFGRDLYILGSNGLERTEFDAFIRELDRVAHLVYLE